MTRGRFVLYFLVILLFLLPIGTAGFGQTIESARDKYEAGDFVGAEDELRAILEQDSENFEANTMLYEIVTMTNIQESEKLTELALMEINSKNFETAFSHLEKAIILDPENTRARELYLAIYDVSLIEEGTMEEMIETEELAALEEEEEIVAPPEEAIPREEVALATPKPPEEMEEAEPPLKEYNRAFVKLASNLTFANSNNLDFVDSKVSMLGARFDGRYYFDFLSRRFGLSLDYSGNLVKMGGGDNIKFSAHRLNTAARFRHYFFENDFGRLTVGGRLIYHVFLLQNREDQGVYNFTRLYGPAIGVFVSDPVVYRFLKKNFFRNLGFEGEFTYLFLIGAGDDAPSSPEFYIGSYYDLKRYRFSLGYRRYTIRTSDIKENYNDIELGAGYRF
jgi:hypothetical protein